MTDFQKSYDFDTGVPQEDRKRNQNNTEFTEADKKMIENLTQWGIPESEAKKTLCRIKSRE